MLFHQLILFHCALLAAASISCSGSAKACHGGSTSQLGAPFLRDGNQIQWLLRLVAHLSVRGLSLGVQQLTLVTGRGRRVRLLVVDQGGTGALALRRGRRRLWPRCDGNRPGRGRLLACLRVNADDRNAFLEGVHPAFVVFVFHFLHYLPGHCVLIEHTR